MPRLSLESLRKRLRWSDLDEAYLRQLIGLAKIEDLAGAGLAEAPKRMGDVTTALMPEHATGAAVLSAREPLVACGLPLVALTLEAYGEDCRFDSLANDGDAVAAGTILGRLRGPATALLQAERVLLNFIQRLSGIATETRRYADALGASPTALLDTRKTTPGYRVLEKYAFACGGGANHRIGLFDRVMLKDNHLEVAGATGGDRLTETVARARAAVPDLPVEVEVDAIKQIEPALEAGADIILLDNFTPTELGEAVALVAGRAYTEASGGITLESIPELGGLGLDFISTGAPVHKSCWKDIGLDWERE